MELPKIASQTKPTRIATPHLSQAGGGLMASLVRQKTLKIVCGSTLFAISCFSLACRRNDHQAIPAQTNRHQTDLHPSDRLADPAQKGEESIVAVSGRSMAPTLCPHSQLAVCDQCDWRQVVAGDARAIACSRCGHEMAFKEASPPDLCQIDFDLDRSKIKRDDILLWRRKKSDSNATPLPSIKRVFAVAGDEVFIRPNGCLVCRPQRLDQASTFVSWKRNELSPPRWIVADERFTKGSRSKDEAKKYSHWLHENKSHFFHHYRKSMPSPIYDDIPFNNDVTRALNQVERIVFSGTVLPTLASNGPPARLTVFFWSEESTRQIELTVLPGERFEASIDNAKPVGNSDLKLSPKVPIAYQVEWAETDEPKPPHDKPKIVDRIVERLAEHFIDVQNMAPSLSKRFGKRNSFIVPEGKFFLVGDNSAVSQDSRAFGLADRDELFAIVKEKISSKQRQH